MNPRIQELAEQSTEKIHRFNYTIGHRTETVFDKEKFAELIVREVFAKIENESFEVYQPVKESVMKYFGVNYESI